MGCALAAWFERMVARRLSRARTLHFVNRRRLAVLGEVFTLWATYARAMARPVMSPGTRGTERHAAARLAAAEGGGQADAALWLRLHAMRGDVLQVGGLGHAACTACAGCALRSAACTASACFFWGCCIGQW